jgi:hypothetical protein
MLWLPDLAAVVGLDVAVVKKDEDSVPSGSAARLSAAAALLEGAPRSRLPPMARAKYESARESVT